MPTDDVFASDRADLPPDVADAPFPYMRWAKHYLSLPDTINLGMSGVPHPATWTLPAVGTPGTWDASHSALRAAVARRAGVDPSQVHLGAGSSAANFTAYHTLARGGRIAVEAPAYQALHALVPAVGASLVTFTRDPADDWRLDPASLALALEEDLDLIVVTDLHNPSGKRLHPDDLDRLLEAAEQQAAFLLVDEVYLDFDPQDRPTAARRSPRVVVTNSLTKCYGLGPFRFGWTLADPAVVERLEHEDDIINPMLSLPTLGAALDFLSGADARLAANRAAAAEACERVDAWVRTTDGVRWTRPDAGLTGLIETPGVHGTPLCAALLEQEKVVAVPGAFFQVPEAFRISFLVDPDDLARALDAVARTLDTQRAHA